VLHLMHIHAFLGGSVWCSILHSMNYDGRHKDDSDVLFLFDDDTRPTHYCCDNVSVHCFRLLPPHTSTTRRKHLYKIESTRRGGQRGLHRPLVRKVSSVQKKLATLVEKKQQWLALPTDPKIILFYQFSNPPFGIGGFIHLVCLFE
jgi:hypothetical protein